MYLGRSAVLAAVLVGLTAPAYAATIVMNSAPEYISVNQTSNFALFAAQFTSPSVETSITSVILPLGATSELAALVNLTLYSDGGGVPGTPLIGLGSQTVTGHADYTFTPAFSVGLDASELYWLVLQCSNCTAPTIGNDWYQSQGATVVGLPGADVALGIGYSGDGGSSWGIFFRERAFRFQVIGDAETNGIPEPGTASLMGAGIAAAWLIRCRRQSRGAKA